jgi:hypothetical protein
LDEGIPLGLERLRGLVHRALLVASEDHFGSASSAF